MAVVVGCSQPYAASDVHPLTPCEQNLKFILDRQDQQRVDSTFAGLAVGHKAVDPPSVAAAPTRMRWSDVEIAVVYACDEAEMAVVSTSLNEEKTRYQFQLKTIEDWPGELIVERVDDVRVYLATVCIGLFNNHPDRAEKLRSALESQMKSFGKKRKINFEN